MRIIHRDIKHLSVVMIVAAALAMLVFACVREQNKTQEIAGTASGMMRHKYSNDAPLGIRYTQKHPLIIAADWDRHPYSYMNDHGEPAGIHVELIKSIFDKFHLNYEIHLKDNRQSLEDLRSGNAHLLMEFSNMPLSPGIRMGKTNAGDYGVVALRRRSTPQLRSLMLLSKSDTVMVKPAAFTNRFMLNHFAGNPPFVLEHEFIFDGVARLLRGEAQYYVSGEQQIKQAIARYGYDTDLVIDAVDLVSGQFRFFSNDPVLLAEVDRVTAIMRQNGQLQELYEKGTRLEKDSHSLLQVNEVTVVLGLVSIIILVVLVVLFLRMRSSSLNLKREFQAVIDMASQMNNCMLVAYNTKSDWVHNLTGDFLPPKGCVMADYEQLIHPDDVLLHYTKRKQLDDKNDGDYEPILLRMHKYGEPGNWRLMKLNVSQLQGADGDLWYVLVSLTDVTDMRHYQQELNQEIVKYKGMNDYGGHGIAHYDKNGGFANANSAYFKVFGKLRRSQGEMFVRNTRLRELMQLLGGVDLTSDANTWYTTRLEVPQLEVRTVVEVQLHTVKGPDGMHRGYMLMISEVASHYDLFKETKSVTARVNYANAQVQRYTTEIKYLMWRNHFIMFHWHVGNDYFDYSSDAHVYGRRITFKQYIDIQKGEDRERVRKVLENAETIFSKSGHVRRCIDKHKTFGPFLTEDFSPSSKDIAWFDMHWGAHYDENGQFTGIHGVIVDNTNNVNNEKALREAMDAAARVDVEKQQFMQNMTHELRTPLNAVNGFAEMMLYPTTPEERREYVNIMIHNSRLLFSLVDNILQMSMIEVEGMQLHPHEVDFAKMFSVAAPKLSKYLYNDDVQFRVDTPLGSLPVMLDDTMVMRVLEMFVNNSAKFTKKGVIHVGYRYLDGQLTVYCRDTGCGMAQDFVPHLPEPFVKADTFVPGIGLGLSLCYTIAHAMGGDIDCYTEEGKGTTMSLVLPDVRRITPISTPPPYTR